MWSDNETTEDLLGFGVHSELICDLIRNDNLMPLTIGLFGDWGSGKSSLLKIIKEQLEDDKDTLVLYYNGWVFEGYDDAKAALLESIVKGFEENKGFGKKVKGKAKELYKSINWMRILGFSFKNIVVPGTTALMTQGVSLIPFLVSKFQAMKPEDLGKQLTGDKALETLSSFVKEKDDGPEMLVREFRDQFAELIEESGVKRLIVLIDDLDRCTPDRIVENLEAIKLFLNVEKTAFVIGADPRIVRHAIQYRYQTGGANLGEDSRIVDDYLEKLIQVPYYVPKLSSSEVETYLSLLICKKDLEPEIFDKVLAEFEGFKEKNRYSIFGISNLKDHLEERSFKELEVQIRDVSKLVSIITQSLYGNPRQIKRFLNTFTLRRKLSEIAKISNFEDSILAKLMILEYSELNLFNILFKWQMLQEGKPKELEELEQLVENEEDQIGDELRDWNKPKVIQWLKTEPKLGTKDLRDYFWISRDKISTTISGASMIPPVVRSVFESLIQVDIPTTLKREMIKDNYMNFIDTERASFMELASENLLAESSKKEHYEVFHLLIEEGATEAVDAYIEVLKSIANTKIPAGVGESMKSLKMNPKLNEILTERFNSNRSKAGKAFNLD
jgi:hypothetical protein|tara:strand:- start:40160 stop:42004 length:1845 start_codon:yes stop_codon:yes gene_type:complete